MKHITYIFAIVIIALVSCKGKEISIAEIVAQRAAKDTTLVFQGITIGAAYDSAKVDSAKLTLPVDVDNHKFSYFEADNNPSSNRFEYAAISTGNGNPSETEYFEIIRFYAGKYGEPSWFQEETFPSVIKQHWDIGAKDETGQKELTSQDAIDFIQHSSDENSQFSFAWEWKNQSIIVRYAPNLNGSSSITIGYWNNGASQKTKN